MRAWSIVLPVKGGPAAKSRLGAGAALAAAIALDCLDAVLACPAADPVIVVTADVETASAASAAGALIVPERAPGTGLLAAVADGVSAAKPDRACAVLLADLPALRSEDLAAALAAADGALGDGVAMAFVPDASGTGTVLLAAHRPDLLIPAFGAGSAAAHAGLGAVRLDLDLPRLRRDADTAEDLRQAGALGLGPRTTAVLRRRSSPSGRP